MGQREWNEEYIQSRYGAEPEHLWAKCPNYVVFRQPPSRKWFGIIIRILPGAAGSPGEQALAVMNVKCSTMMIGSLRSTKVFTM